MSQLFDVVLKKSIAGNKNENVKVVIDKGKEKGKIKGLPEYTGIRGKNWEDWIFLVEDLFDIFEVKDDEKSSHVVPLLRSIKRYLSQSMTQWWV